MKDFSSFIADLPAQVTHAEFDKCVPTFATIRKVQKKLRRMLDVLIALDLTH